MLKISKNGVVLSFKIVPNSQNFEFLPWNDWINAYKIKTKSPAVDNRANKELLENLKKFFNAEVEIVAGQKSSLKKVLIKANEKQVVETLKKFL